MTQPIEAVVVQGPVSPEATEIDGDKGLKAFFDADPREEIYAKSDAIRAKELVAEAGEDLESPDSATEDLGGDPQDASKEGVLSEDDSQAVSPKDLLEKEEGGEVIDREEFERRTAKWTVKGKFFGEESEIPAKDFLKTAGMEKRYQKKLEEVVRREQSLNELQYRAIQPTHPVEPPPAGSFVNPAVPLHQLTDEQIEKQFNELAVTSPFQANAFLSQVQEARVAAQREYAGVIANQAKATFMDTYGYTEDSPEWERINDREFFEQYPDILGARDRGDYYGMFMTAEMHRREEALKEREAALRESVRKSDEKNEAKKKGQVLRGTVKPEPEKPTAPEFETPGDFIRRMASERRAKQGIGAGFST